MPPPPPALPDELLEEIFLRLPPDEPEHLVRASLASKLWLGLLSGARFRGRYHEHHRAPPMLGFLYSCHTNSRPETDDNIPHHEISCAHSRRRLGGWDYGALDCRHGRVLIGEMVYQPMTLVVWDPMTGCRRELDAPDLVDNSYGAAVLCVVTGCDHRTCHAGPFQVVFVGLDDREDDCVAQACVSLPVTGNHSKPGFRSPFDKWSKPCSALHLDSDVYIYEAPPVFIQDTLHFKLCNCAEDRVVGILKYDMSTNCLSLIDMPLAGSVNANASILMMMDDDSLGFAHVDGLILNLWSRNMGFDGVASWTQRTVVNIKDILPIRNSNKRLRLIGSVEGTDIIFVTTDLGTYKINLKSLQWKKVWERKKFRAFIPYMSFYNPQGLRNDGDKKNLLEGSSAEVRAHDAVSVAPIGQLPRITQAGEDDLETELDEDLESESEEDLESESEKD